MPDFDLLLTDGEIVTPSGRGPAAIGIRDGRIAAIGDLGGAAAAERISVSGLTVLPGVIDSQVHFREPGATHKEDLESGTRAAAMGGVTAVFEMPNTAPQTVDAAAIQDKLDRAAGRAHVDHAFFVGATGGNADLLGALERLPGVCGVKIFMGSSTGGLLLPDDGGLARALRSGVRRIAIHAEDDLRLTARKDLAEAGRPETHPVWRDEETAIRATRRILHLASAAGRRIHVLHITTAQEMALLAEFKDLATVEVTPQHLTLAAPDCYAELGTHAQMNPPIRDAHHRAALWQAVADGVVDVIGSDHAPHTAEEKAKDYPATPSGMPGVQTLVPLMLNHVAAGRLSLERFVDLTSAGPQRIYGIAGKGRIAVGYDADFTIVDLGAKRRIEQDWLASRCGWSPFAGMNVSGWPVMTVIRGQVVMRDDELLAPGLGRPCRFVETLPTRPL
ncbi:dihydroorotase [Marinibaculum pumilum]|uniref:Dihydroorotase n=1 Tax=Marinibaculum pumilum TaxID=1766165 RepID=A0ABV7L8V0_9PROT